MLQILAYLFPSLLFLHFSLSSSDIEPVSFLPFSLPMLKKPCDYEGGDGVVKDRRQSAILKLHPRVVHLCIQSGVLAYEHTQVCILNVWVLVVVRILENTLSL